MVQRALPGAPARKAPWVRTCVGCRRRAPASELLRVVAVGGEAGGIGRRESADQLRLVADPARRAPGRGAYLHLDPACLALARRRHAFGRALRRSGVLDAGALVEFFDRWIPEPGSAGEEPDVTEGGAHRATTSRAG